MKTVLIFGASSTHGVGGGHGGWADRIKTWLHGEMYGASGSGEGYTVYELGIPGETARDVVSRFEVETLARLPAKRTKNDVYFLFSAGTNDSKATGAANNYLHTPDEYATNVQAFIHLAKEFANDKHIMCVGLSPVDQTKTNPKRNPLNGSNSYFTNQRIGSFEEMLVRVCKKEGVSCVPLFANIPDNWIADYAFVDGVHPNDAGHEWIFEHVKPVLQKMLGVKK